MTKISVYSKFKMDKIKTTVFILEGTLEHSPYHLKTSMTGDEVSV